MRLASEVTRGPSDKPEIDQLYAALMTISNSLQKANELREDQMAGDDEEAEVQTRRWHLDNCREWVVGCGGICTGLFGGLIIGVVSTYFGIQSECAS